MNDARPVATTTALRFPLRTVLQVIVRRPADSDANESVVNPERLRRLASFAALPVGA